MIDTRDMDLNLLVIFQEVFQERQISRVARKLGLSQPAVSNALARLRRHFGDDLFVRTTTGMQPTPFALQIAEPVAQALHHVRQALNFHEAFEAESSTRHFKIAMTDVGEVYFMPALVELCSRFAPHVRLSTIRASSIDVMTEMEAGKIDLAVGAFDKVSGALYQRRLFRQDYVTMLRKDHVLAKRSMTQKEFVAAQHIIVASQESPYERVNQTLEKAGVRAAAHFEVPHFVAVPYIVSTTDLLVTVPEKLAQRAAVPFNLHYFKPPLKLPALQTNLFWHRRFGQDVGNQWLRSFIFDHLAE